MKLNFMKNITEKIANIKINFFDNCSEKEKNIINEYWEINEKFEFTNGLKEIKLSHNLTSKELTNLIQNHTSLNFYGYCSKCNSYEHNSCTSRSSCASLMHSIKKRYHVYECKNCIRIGREIMDAEIEEEIKEDNRLQKIFQLKAIEDKEWMELNKFDYYVLKSCIDFNSFESLKRYYKKKIGEKNYPNLFISMKTLEKNSLLKLSFFEYNKYWISDYQFHPNLKEEFFKSLVIRDSEFEAQKINPTQDSPAEELKIELTINDISDHPDKPKFAGIVSFKENIVLKKGVKYVFGMWERVNNELHLTFIPAEKIAKSPKQIRLSKESKYIQEIINDFLNT